MAEHRVTSSFGVCLEVGSRRVVAHISAEVARKLVESLLRGIDGIIYGCNFVIGNGSLAVVNLDEKFMRLVTGLYTYNKLDAKSFYDDNAVTNHIEYVVKDAGSVADDDIEFGR
mgnify:CR=1 FL=1